MAKSGVHVVGAVELGKALAALTPALEKKVLRQAMRKAAKPILAQAKANAPVGKPTTELRALAKNTIAFGRAFGATEKQVQRAATRAVAQATREAKKGKQRYPGQLRDSLRLRAMKSKKGRIGMMVQTREGDYRGDTFYGAFIEYGTNKMAAKPYMRPAFDTKKGEAAKIIEHEIRAGIAKIASEVKA
jgi:HK97 gp10 family phage protein